MRGVSSVTLFAYEYRSEPDKKFVGNTRAVEPRTPALQEMPDALGMYQATVL